VPASPFRTPPSAANPTGGYHDSSVGKAVRLLSNTATAKEVCGVFSIPSTKVQSTPGVSKRSFLPPTPPFFVQWFALAHVILVKNHSFFLPARLLVYDLGKQLGS